jgi:hypothetical protein
VARIENTPPAAASLGQVDQPARVKAASTAGGVDFALLLSALQQEATGAAGGTVGATGAAAQVARWLAAGVNLGDDVQLLLGLADLPMPGRVALPGGAATGGAAPAADSVNLARLSPQERFQALKPAFVQAEKETGVPWQVQAAQWALESGWGRFTPRDMKTGRESYNLFGVKGEGPAGAVSALTTEFVGGMKVPQTARFRAYTSYAESIVEHARLLNGPYYARAHAAGADLRQWTEMLGPQNLGYATDPEYSGKLWQIIQENGWDR